MVTIAQYIKKSATYKLFSTLLIEVVNFLDIIGGIIMLGYRFVVRMFKDGVNLKELFAQCERFGISSLPITLSIVGMTSIIVSSQVANEMVKQGGADFVGMLMTILIVREVGAVMSGFAIISMIGSSMASELATMRVTEQIDAITVLGVNPVRYLFVPRILAGTLMMPPVLVISSVFGILGGALASVMTSELSYRAYFASVRSGLFLYDMKVALLKAIVYGFTIVLISCTCGYIARGGAKGVGIATTKAVVWSFVAIVVWDLIFSAVFFF